MGEPGFEPRTSGYRGYIRNYFCLIDPIFGMKPFIASVLKNWGDAVGKSISSGFHFYAPLFISCVTSGK